MRLLFNLNGVGKRGQVLSYDAIGGVVIFAIAMGILLSYWSSLDASFSDEDAVLVLEANTALDNLMRDGVLLDGKYKINEGFLTGRQGCIQKGLDKNNIGITHNYTLSIYDGDSLLKINDDVVCTDSKDFDSSKIRKSAISERIAYYKDRPVKVVMHVFIPE